MISVLEIPLAKLELLNQTPFPLAVNVQHVFKQVRSTYDPRMLHHHPAYQKCRSRVVTEASKGDLRHVARPGVESRMDMTTLW